MNFTFQCFKSIIFVVVMLTFFFISTERVSLLTIRRTGN